MPAVCLHALLGLAAALGADDASLRAMPATVREAYVAFETRLRQIPSAESLTRWHESLCSEPHVAGTEGDLRTADFIAGAFRDMGLEVEKHEVWAYLCRPVSAVLEIVAPERVPLGIREEALAEDRYSHRPDLHPGWNAYSGNGDVTAEVVYANYGTKADFQRLRELGVDCTGKIVIARYGGNYRGYKARFAEAAGAAGLIIYTDPADSGFCKGIVYPEGGYANDTCIQRGSLSTVEWEGDPLTPFEPATKDARRLDPDAVGLPRIPVQPIGWGAAREILSRMTGPPVPQPRDGESPASSWQGGLPCAYRLTGGPDLKVRLKVEQDRFVARTYNVLGTLRGTAYPEQLVLVGAHHDAWGYGAADPCSGTITVLEAARSFTEALRAPPAPDSPVMPLRSIVFCAWGAEEFGLIGSVEWVEANRDRLFRNAVAYINLDMASMGLDFGAAASPSLRRVIADAARSVPQPGGPDGQTVYDAWLSKGPDPLDALLPKTGDIGGGSDHVAFNCHLAISVAGMGASGSKGTSYHSIYDNLQWYWKVVGADYGSAMMVTRVAQTVAARLACAPVPPLDLARPATDARAYLRRISADGFASGFLARGEPGPAPPGDPAVARELEAVDLAAQRCEALARGVADRLDAAAGAGRLSPDNSAAITELVLQLDRGWYRPEGLPGRPWFRSLLAATDEDSGYAAWMLPALRRAVEHRDRIALDEAVALYLGVFDRLSSTLAQIEQRLIDHPAARTPEGTR
jgi:N-acetylated-alpha-linked acidic dipeptidase